MSANTAPFTAKRAKKSNRITSFEIVNDFRVRSKSSINNEKNRRINESDTSEAGNYARKTEETSFTTRFEEKRTSFRISNIFRRTFFPVIDYALFGAKSPTVARTSVSVNETF